MPRPYMGGEPSDPDQILEELGLDHGCEPRRYPPGSKEWELLVDFNEDEEAA